MQQKLDLVGIKKEDIKNRVGKRGEDVDAEGEDDAFDQNIWYTCVKFSKNIVLRKLGCKVTGTDIQCQFLACIPSYTPAPHTTQIYTKSLKTLKKTLESVLTHRS